jgi:ElaB/YqjD/DUF883 family membrane-anchored ribosome-binding protein
MLTRAQMERHWSDLVPAVTEHWPLLGGEELEEARGSVGHLVGLIQQRTGEERAKVEQFLDSVVEPARSYFRQTSQQLSTMPWTAVGSAFALGVVAGLVIERLVDGRSG